MKSAANMVYQCQPRHGSEQQTWLFNGREAKQGQIRRNTDNQTTEGTQIGRPARPYPVINDLNYYIDRPLNF